jgi:TRAP-type C4-dicarboxylate transport system permease small subunit
MRVVARLLGALTQAAAALSAALVLVSLALIAWAVLMRYALNRPPAWVDDTVGFMLVGVVMLAAAQVQRRGEHIGVDLLAARLSARGRRWMDAWAAAASLAAAAVLVVNGWSTAMFSRMLGIVAEGNVEIPVFWIQLALPLGGAVMGLVALESLARLAAGMPPAEAPQQAPSTE